MLRLKAKIGEGKFAGWEGWLVGKFAGWEGWLAPAQVGKALKLKRESLKSESLLGWEGWLAPAPPQHSLTTDKHSKLSIADQRGQATLPNLRIFSLELSFRSRRLWTAKLAITLIFIALTLCACSVRAGADHLATTTGSTSGSLSQEERHRLYTAALAASDSPLDTALFKEVCQKIGIFDADGNPNGIYMTFVQEHVQWGMKTETNQFRSQINTKERAQEYVRKHLP
ncbi:MAG TPA: hypothetical protein VJ124_05695 [Pyrinomonadaceae bacterium]|nr:hypothetical protein [Pyrinomonadaceae bacterium]